jgi:hypothetical protein
MKNFINIWINSKWIALKMTYFDVFKSNDKLKNRKEYVENFANLGMSKEPYMYNFYGCKTIFDNGRFIAIDSNKTYQISVQNTIDKLKIKYPRHHIFSYKHYQDNFSFFKERDLFTESRAKAYKQDITKLKHIGFLVQRHDIILKLYAKK